MQKSETSIEALRDIEIQVSEILKRFDWRGCQLLSRVLDFKGKKDIIRIMNSKRSISHDFSDETIEAKTLWFRSLTMSERMEMLCAFTDLAFAINPQIAEKKDAQPVAGRIQVLRIA